MSAFRTGPATTARESVRRWAIGQRDIEILGTFSPGKVASAGLDAQIRLAVLGLLHFSSWEVTQLGREILETAPPKRLIVTTGQGKEFLHYMVREGLQPKMG